MKQPIYLSIAIVSSILFFLEIRSVFSLGKILNSFFPCIQDPANSFPCYGIYDIWITLIALFIAIVGYIVFFIHKKR